MCLTRALADPLPEDHASSPLHVDLSSPGATEKMALEDEEKGVTHCAIKNNHRPG